MKERFSRFLGLAMLRTRVLLWLVVAGAIVLGAVFSANAGLTAKEASEEPQPEAISEAGEQTLISEAGEQTLDDLFAQVARRNPAFGGMFVDEERQTLFVYSKDARPEAVSPLKEGFEAVLGPGRVPQFKIEVLPAQYSFVELMEWQERMTADILGIPGVVLVDVDDTKNRLTVGVEKLVIQCAIEAQLSRLGIPRESVNIEVTPTVELEVSLRDRHRPLVGGLQISFWTLAKIATFSR